MQRKKDQEYRQYVGIEKGLMFANTNYISVDKEDMEWNKTIIELIVRYLIKRMRAESPTFNYLYVDIFGGGSGYEGLKITKADEFDIDILLRIPKVAGPVLIENNIPGYVNLRLENFHKLKGQNLEVYTDMQSFIDDKNYLLTKEMKGSFMQSIFDRIMSKVPDNIFQISGHRFKIMRVQSLGPAFTLTIEGPYKFHVKVDLVPCILLNKRQWPGEGFESNPYSQPSDFFIVPKSPSRDIPHIERYWRLSFQKQEREIIFDKQCLKPTIRILKKIRDNFGHRVSSYAIKTMFLKKLKLDNPSFADEIPELWLLPLSYCVVYMLEVYAECLGEGKIPYFWNKKMNLLEDLDLGQTTQYKKDIEDLLQNVRTNSVPETIIRYLR